jgi:hypothetical protein
MKRAAAVQVRLAAKAAEMIRLAAVEQAKAVRVRLAAVMAVFRLAAKGLAVKAVRVRLAAVMVTGMMLIGIMTFILQRCRDARAGLRKPNAQMGSGIIRKRMSAIATQ